MAAPVRTPMLLERWDRVRELIRRNPEMSLDAIRALEE